MAATNMNLTGIARKLVLDKHLDEATAIEAVENANKESVQLTSYLVKNKIVPSNVVAMISSQEFGLPVFDLKVMDMEMAQRDTAVQAWQQTLYRHIEPNQHPGARRIQVCNWSVYRSGTGAGRSSRRIHRQGRQLDGYGHGRYAR
jgi:hypothetical protein